MAITTKLSCKLNQFLVSSPHMHTQSSLWDGAAEICWVCLGREAEKNAQSATCLVAEQDQGVNTVELQYNAQSNLSPDVAYSLVNVVC